MAAALPDFENAPAPLEFFRADSIHADNKSLIDQEQKRWRLLKWYERIRLKRYIASLSRQLHKAHYNQLVLQVDRLRRDVRAAKRDFRHAAPGAERDAAREKITRVIDEARPLLIRLHELKPTYELFNHYSGWLDYEAKHRRELKTASKREKHIESEMNRESKYLEQLLVNVFRMTPGCHYRYYERDGKKQITKTPRFERAVIKPDAHYFYLAASSRWLFGWRWKLPYGVSVDRLTEDEVIHNMHAATKRQVTPMWSETGQVIFRVSRLDSPDALPTEVKWRDAMPFFPKKDRDKLPYTIGVNEGRKFQWFDLEHDPHILVAGKSQSGKSNLVNGIIATMVMTHSPDELRMVLVDQKGGLEFSHWYELPHLLWDIVKTVEEVKPVFIRIVTMMKTRFTIMERVKAKKIADYNAKVDAENRMARVVVIIDEMNTFVGLKEEDEIHNLLALIVSQGRAVGIHVITATQHPEVKVIPSRIKTNMSMRLCGAMPTNGASQIVLDTGLASELPNIPGRFICVSGLMTMTVQVPRIFDEDIAGVVSSTVRQYPEVAEELQDLKDVPKPIKLDEDELIKLSLLWFDGRLSADELHKTLGSESPGERQLRRSLQKIKDEVANAGYFQCANGTRYQLRRRGIAYYLMTINSGKPDKPNVSDIAESRSPVPESVSVLENHETELAAD